MLQLLHSLSWKSWRRFMAHGGGAGRRQRPVRRFRPRLEALEDRTLLSIFTVNNLDDSGPGSLRAAINSANAAAGSTINFAPGLTGTINLNSQLPISVSMEIDGPGASVITVSGQNNTRVFNVSVGVVTINDLTIADGKTPDFGGGIHDFSGSLNLSRVTFANNQAAFGGGGLFTEFAFVTVTDCVFNGNLVVAPAGTQGAVLGSAISSLSGALTVIGSEFTNNIVLGANNVASAFANEDLGLAGGGAVACVGDSSDIFSGDTFTSNSARGGRGDFGGSGTYTIGDGQGGAIEIRGSVVEVDLSTFSSNVAEGGRGFDGAGGGRIGLGLGGAIQVDTGSQLTVNNSTFSSNHALGANFGTGVDGTLMNEGVGGAINDEGSTTFLTIAGSTFSDNTAVGGISGFLTAAFGRFGSGAVGGAINLGLGGSGDISGSTFTSNVVRGGNGTGDGSGGEALGGAIDTFPTSLTISSSQFDNNRAQGGLGGPSAVFGGVGEGGGLFADGGNIILLDLLFSSNEAIGGIAQGTGHLGGTAFGGGLSVIFAIVSADRLTVESNVAQGGAGLNGANGGSAFGGGIEAFFNAACTIADSFVTLNKALGGIASGGGSKGGGFGGGIDFFGAFDFPNTLVTGNFASTARPDI